MKIKRIDLSWITTSDMKKAKQFFTETVGLKVRHEMAEFGWLALGGHEGGSSLGVGLVNTGSDQKPGTNAIVTLEVDDIVAAKKELESKKVKFIGDIMEVPGQVKLALFTDPDDNKFQLVQRINK